MGSNLSTLKKADLIKLIETMDNNNSNKNETSVLSSNDRLIIKSGIVGKTIIKPSKTREITIIGHSRGTKISLKELENCSMFTDNLIRLLESGLLYFDNDNGYDFLGLDVPSFKYSEKNLNEVFLNRDIVEFIKKQVNYSSLNNNKEVFVKEYTADELTILNTIQYNIARFVINGNKLDMIQQANLNEFFKPITVAMLCEYYKMAGLG